MFKKVEKVSVVIAAWNGERYIGEAIDSIQKQTFPVHETIVVIDGSNDGTEAVARRYKAINIVIQKNAGRSAARNVGIMMVTGDAIVVLDQDDILLPRNIEIGVQKLNENRDAAFSGGFSVGIDNNGARIADTLLGSYGPCSYGSMLRGAMFVPPSVIMFRREVLQKVGGFDPTFRRGGEDSDLYLRIAQNWPVHSHEEIVVEYRRHPGNGSNDAEAMLTTSLQFMKKQVVYIEENLRFRVDFEAGLRHWKSLFGKYLIPQAIGLIRQRSFKRALFLLLLALRHNPVSYMHYLQSCISKLRLAKYFRSS